MPYFYHLANIDRRSLDAHHSCDSWRRMASSRSTSTCCSTSFGWEDTSAWICTLTTFAQAWWNGSFQAGTEKSGSQFFSNRLEKSRKWRDCRWFSENKGTSQMLPEFLGFLGWNPGIKRSKILNGRIDRSISDRTNGKSGKTKFDIAKAKWVTMSSTSEPCPLLMWADSLLLMQQQHDSKVSTEKAKTIIQNSWSERITFPSELWVKKNLSYFHCEHLMTTLLPRNGIQTRKILRLMPQYWKTSLDHFDSKQLRKKVS